MHSIQRPDSRNWLALGAAVLALIFLVVGVFTPGRYRISRDRATSMAGTDLSHSAWTELLRRYVDASGNVDYAKWSDSKEDLQRLDEYLASLSRQDHLQFANKSQQLAFWINTYNAVTIRRILRGYPSRKSNSNRPQDEPFVVNNSAYSLDDIEHSVLRQLSDPRIHFAIVCGARGCPRLRDEAYEGDRLEEQLEQNARSFFADASKLTLDEQRGELRLSPILEWYAADFGVSTPDNILQSIAPWLPDDARKSIEAGKLRIKFNDYDWTLNDQSQVTEPPLPPPEPSTVDET